MMKKMWFIMGVSGLVAGCAPQAPANVVSGLGGQGNSYNSRGYAVPAAQTATSRAVTKTAGANEPLVSREAQLRAATGQVDDMAAIEPAAGPGLLVSRAPSDAEMGRITAPVVKTPVAAPKVAPKVDVEMVTHHVTATDTGYKLARKYNTSVDRILKENNLKAVSDIREGQALTIAKNSNPTTSAWDDMKNALSEQPTPQPVQVAHAPVDETKLAAIEPAAGRLTAPVAQAPAAVEYVRHTVQPKETIYRISLQYNTSVLDIMAANEFAEPQDLKADSVIKVPVRGSISSQLAAKVEKAAEVAPAAGGVVPVVIEKADAPVQVAMLGKAPLGAAEAKAEELETKAVQQQALNDAAIPAKKANEPSVDIAKLAEAKRGQVDSEAARAKGLVWPVKGQVIRKFGDDGSGVARTGINIAVPAGTPVLASEGGQVLYADDGLKIYGKMVLVRHDNGMVSAYAHNGYLLVKKNERVKKGQVIALSGNSGNVESPQLHFELRQHASAVDPIAMLPRL